MLDIVDRLRERSEIAAEDSRHGDENDFLDAADEIKRLRAMYAHVPTPLGIRTAILAGAVVGSLILIWLLPPA